ncbi:MAG TPA: hypothetical protein VI260_16890 [Blastocatellia bacterium]
MKNCWLYVVIRRGLKARSRQCADSTHVLASIRGITRLECVGESVRAALNVLAVVAPDWVIDHSREGWLERCSARIEERHQPKNESHRLQLAGTYGEDGLHMFNAVFAPSSPTWLSKVPAVDMPCLIWIQEYYLHENVLCWSKAEEIPPASALI